MGKRFSRVAALALAVGWLAACSESAGPVANVHLRITDFGVDSGFSDSGYVTVGLVPTYQNGSIVPPSAVTITATTSDGTPVTVVSVAQEPDPRSIAAVVSLDNSSSLATNDPNRERATAAQLFYDYVLGQKPTNLVSLMDFSAQAPTAGFNYSRLLHDWTNSTSALDSVLPLIQAATVQGTPLFESLIETLQFINHKSSDNYDRSILLLTDGLPENRSKADSAIHLAQNYNIPVHTVGLGPASDVSGSSDSAAVAVVRQIAEQTGGVYASVTDASGLESVFQKLAVVVVQGRLQTVLKIGPPIPPSGTEVTIIVTVKINGRSTSSKYTFVVP
jgi:hypothetical protein